MAYYNEILQQQAQQLRVMGQQQQDWGLPVGTAVSSVFPTWEVTAPQYQIPAAWSLIQTAKYNEVAHACIDLWMDAISEPAIQVVDKETGDDVGTDEFYKFMEQPCPDLSQTDFLAATEMFLKIAGALPWEKDFANDGTLIHLWPMMPQYCSFMRGQGQLLRAIRYQPYTGLPYYDVDRSRVCLFMYPDPQYFGLKPLSPTAVIADVLGVDNDMTKMVGQFLKNGAFVSGLLSTEQVINEADARFAKERFRQDHGGPNNAGDVVVLGKGMEFQKMNNTFREMVFPEVDARNESRICMTYGVKPILVSAKIGMDRSTYSNYEQARKAWYEENVTSEWKFIAERLTKDILPHFDTNPNHVVKFDVKSVKALQEDRTETWKRAVVAYEKRIITRNDALKEMGLDPLTDSVLGDEYYTTVMSQSSTTNDLDVKDNSETPEEAGIVKTPKPTDEQKQKEEKDFRAFAKRRLKENKAADIPEFEFKYIDPERQRQLLTEYNVPDPDAEMVLKALLAVVAAEKKTAVPNVNITAHIQPGAAPSVTVEPAPVTVQAAPAPIVNVDVQPAEVKSGDIIVTPAPVTIQNEMPRVKRTVQHVSRDGGNNIDGTVTSYIYEE